MRLMIKDKYFRKIKSGEKEADYRDAHITFVNEETGETFVKKVTSAHVMPISMTEVKDNNEGMFEDDSVIVFELA